MKKFIALFMTVLMVFSVFSMVSFSSAGENDVKKISYVLSKEVYTPSKGNGYTASMSYSGRGELTKKVVVSGNKTTTEVFAYASQGNQTEYTRTDDRKTEKYTYLYTDKNELSYEGYSHSGNMSASTAYTYDSNGNLLKESFSSTNGMSSTIESTINEEGLKTKEVLKDSTGSVSETTFTYDANGNVIKESVSTNYGSNHEWKYSYNSDGRLVKKVYTNSDDESCSYSYSYDASGRVKKETVKDFYDYSYSCSYTYDSAGHLTKKTYSDNDGYTEKTTFTYDKDNLVKEVIKKDSGYTGTTLYTYDQNNNLVKKEYKDSARFSSVTTYEYKKLSSPVYERGSLSFKMNAKAGYMGSAVKNSVAVYDKNRANAAGRDDIHICLKNGIDYKLSYKNNVNPGKASVTVTFKGEYADEAPITFTYTIVDYQVKDVKASKISLTGATLNWSAVTGTTKYKVQQSTDGINWTDAAVTDNTTVNLSKLKANSTYYFKVTAVSSSGSALGLASDICKVATLFNAPSVSKASTKSITIAWPEANGASAYKVEKSEDGKTWTNEGTHTGNSASITGLKAGTKYSVRVRAINGNNKVVRTSAVLNTQTLCSAPVIKVKSSAYGTATVTITKVTGASRYIIYTSNDGNTWTRAGSTSSTTANLTWLRSGSTIHVRAVAVNSDSRNSAYSSVVKVKIK